ncbi:hypothetical protein ACGFZL_14815 [Streptomyces sp. NPDC048182]|uniref:hypothetical protein n=1 Tax=Streptomyces sp. NPDC048182 TaxID=3365507 RepID=UPI0037114751
MTQSGQGEEPSARPAREGIVLPSDGGEPLLPGPSGGPRDGRPAPASAPPGAQAWDQPWGPERRQHPAPDQTGHPGQSWPTPPDAQAWPPAAAPTPPQAGPGPLPPEQSQQPSAYGTPGPGSAYGTPAPQYGTPDPYGAAPDPGYGTYGATPSYGAQPAYGYPGPYPQTSHPQTPYQHPANPADEGATQYLPPVPPAADEGATQYIPHIPPGPTPGGVLPPERPATQQYAQPQPQPHHPDADATQYIPPVPAGDAERQPPAEFDNLFRTGPGPEGPASSTQQMPRFDDAPQGSPSPYGPQGAGGGGGYGGYDDHGGHGGGGRDDRGGRSRSRLPLIAAIGVGIAVVGIGAGALLAGGGGDDDAKDGASSPSVSAPASQEPSASASAAPDPVREQAVALDKLLADSGSSRAAVIKAVSDVKGCDSLSGAAKDLRDAAGQRAGLVTSLSKLSVDKLPNHTELTQALTKAWQASASADNHYAAWADQTAGKGGCRKGQAKVTGQTQAGNRASGTASKEKTRASGLWNGIAKRYGLTERPPTQL